MTMYKVLFQEDDVLIHIKAENAKEARKIFNKQIQFKRSDDE